MINKRNLKNISINREKLINEENFVYLLPCKQLRGLISNFTISFPDQSIISGDYTIMPHGCVTLVFFNNDAGLQSLLFGPMTRPSRVGEIAKLCSILYIIEFQPAGFYPFSNLNQRELTDKIVPFSLIHYSLDKAMRYIFSSSLSVDELLLETEKELIRRIQFPYPDEIALAVNHIIKMQGILTSERISGDVFYSQRHLNRLFNLYLGVSMKSFSQLVRINKSIRLLNERKNTLSIISESLDFYDVSHFIKDFKIICGISPQEYRTNMSDFYSEIAKF